MTPSQQKNLIKKAVAAMRHSYAPYSRFRVGAALLTREGRVFQGCNVENASYGLTLCAERTALGAAISAGHRRFTAIAVVASELPRSKSRGNLLRRSSLGYAGRVFAEPCDLSGEALAKTEAKNAIHPCGNLPAVLRTALQAGPQGFLAKKGGPTAPMPCGACLQVLAEFCRPDFVILATTAREPAYAVALTLQELLPKAFRLK